MKNGAQAVCACVGRWEGERGADSLILAFDRLIRCAIVDSGTRKAAAISRVVSPATARSVRGMADAGASDG